MVEITLAEAWDVLRQIEENPEIGENTKAALVERQYRIIIRLLAQRVGDLDKAVQMLYERLGKTA